MRSSVRGCPRYVSSWATCGPGRASSFALSAARPQLRGAVRVHPRQREWAAFRVLADRPPRARMDHRAAELRHTFEGVRHGTIDLEVRQGPGIAGTCPARVDAQGGRTVRLPSIS